MCWRKPIKPQNTTQQMAEKPEQQDSRQTACGSWNKWNFWDRHWFPHVSCMGHNPFNFSSHFKWRSTSENSFETQCLCGQYEMKVVKLMVFLTRPSINKARKTNCLPLQTFWKKHSQLIIYTHFQLSYIKHNPKPWVFPELTAGNRR